jgi:hypothetical protein
VQRCAEQGIAFVFDNPVVCLVHKHGNLLDTQRGLFSVEIVTEERRGVKRMNAWRSSVFLLVSPLIDYTCSIAVVVEPFTREVRERA